MPLPREDALSLSKPPKPWNLVSPRVGTDSKTHLAQRERALYSSHTRTRVTRERDAACAAVGPLV